jgi:Ca2+-binding EF-hand superfamily protein|eukprot:Stramenopile-MAST_4_protein_525
MEAPYKNKHDDIWCASRRGDRRAVFQFLENGADVNVEDECGMTPIYYSVLYSHDSITRILIKWGAKVDIVRHISEAAYEKLVPNQDVLQNDVVQVEHAAALVDSSDTMSIGSSENNAFDLTPIKQARRKPTRAKLSDALREAREDMIRSKGEAWLKKLDTLNGKKEASKKKKKWLSQVNRAFWLQQRELDERKWMSKRKMVDAEVRFTDEQRKELRKWFESLDTDGSGEISFVELAGPLLSTGIATTQREVRDIIDRHKSGTTGGIDFEAFMSLLKPTRKINIKKLYERLDKNPLLDVEKLVREAEEEKKNRAARTAFNNLREQLTEAERSTFMEIDSLISFTRRNKIIDQLKKNTIALAMEKLHKEADVHTSPAAPRNDVPEKKDSRHIKDPSVAEVTSSYSASPIETAKSFQVSQCKPGMPSGNDVHVANKASEEFQRKLRQKKIARERLRRLDNLNSLQRVVKGSLASGITSYWDGEMPEEETDKVSIYNAFTELLPTLQPPDQLRAKERHRQWNFWHERAQGFVPDLKENAGASTTHRRRQILSSDTKNELLIENNKALNINIDGVEEIAHAPIKRQMSASAPDLHGTKVSHGAKASPNAKSSVSISTEIMLSPYQVNIERRYSKFMKPTRADILRREKHKVRARRMKIQPMALPSLTEERKPMHRAKTRVDTRPVQRGRTQMKVPRTTPVQKGSPMLSFSMEVAGVEMRNIGSLI